MKIFIDDDFQCHVTHSGRAMKELETDYFDGKCAEYIEGYRYVPAGDTWTRADGVVFSGEMICPAADFRVLEAAQREFEHAQYLDAMAALEAIYGGDTE